MTHSGASQPGRSSEDKRSHERLVEETLRKQARLIDLAPVAVIVRELDGTIIFWSQGAESMYGWTKEEALGRLTHDVLRTQFPEPMEDIVKKLLQGRKWTGELRHLTKDGRTVIVESHWLAELDSKGEVSELLECNMDITERKRLQEHLEEVVEERTAQLRASNADLEAFSDSMSHDMRAPLRAILNFSQFVIEDCGAELSQTAKDYLEKVTGAARRLDRLILDVLALSQVSKQRVEMGPVELGKLVKDTIHERPEFQEPAAEVRVEGELPQVLGHEALLTQVLSNLLGNAVKFVNRGTKPRVRVWCETIDRKIRLWVEDNGIGIEPQSHQKIFELFGRDQRARDYDGTGIGLTIARKAVERMGGRVGVESDVGGGSRFWVELPRACPKNVGDEVTNL
jgi:PAS domain S-box-containing protein